MSNSILVTGCAGFIGSNFVRAFKREFPDRQIVGIDDFSTGRRDAFCREIAFYEGSITNGDFLERVFKKHRPEHVFHFAAYPYVSLSIEKPAFTSETNILGTVRLIEAARLVGIRRFIYSSSCAVYGKPEHIPTSEESNQLAPISPYGLQKLVGEPFLKMATQLYGFDAVSLRYFNVFGPGQYGGSAYAGVICSWLEHLYFPKPGPLPYLEGDGEQSRDFCYVDNVVHANLLAMKRAEPFRGEAINIGSGERIMLLQTKKLIEEFTGKLLKLERRPERVGDIRHSQADISKAERLLGYRPQVDFAAGLKQTIAWFEQRSASLAF